MWCAHLDAVHGVVDEGEVGPGEEGTQGGKVEDRLEQLDVVLRRVHNVDDHALAAVTARLKTTPRQLSDRWKMHEEGC